MGAHHMLAVRVLCLWPSPLRWSQTLGSSDLNLLCPLSFSFINAWPCHPELTSLLMTSDPHCLWHLSAPAWPTWCSFLPGLAHIISSTNRPWCLPRDQWQLNFTSSCGYELGMMLRPGPNCKMIKAKTPRLHAKVEREVKQGFEIS